MSVAAATVAAMLAEHITEVTLTRTTDPEFTDYTHHPGIEMWLVQWTVTASNWKTERLRSSSYTEVAARALIANLLEQRSDGVTVQDVFREVDS